MASTAIDQWKRFWERAQLVSDKITTKKRKEKTKNNETNKEKANNPKTNRKIKRRGEDSQKNNKKSHHVEGSRFHQASLSGEDLDDNDGNEFGDKFLKKKDRMVRIMFQNICHLSPSKATSKSNQITRFARDNDIDILLMSEIGLRWDRVPTEDQWTERIYGHHEKEKHVFAFNKHDAGTETAVQYGGTGISVAGELTHRVVDKGVDESGLGRWSWIRIKGKNEFVVRVISAYRPCIEAGPLSVGRQHRRYFQSIGCFEDPRKKMLADLKEACTKWAEDGDGLIIGIDANKDVRSHQISEWVESLGLVNITLQKHKDKSPPATFNRNTKREPIDAIWVSASIQSFATGFLGFDCAIQSDHRAIWVDLPFEEVLGYAYPPIDCGSKRKLNSKDPRMVERYCNKVKNLLNNEKIPERLIELERQAMTNGWNEDLEDEFNFLHRRNLEIRTNVERGIRKFRAGAIPWSPKLQEFRDRIELWSMIVKKKKGVKTSSRKIRRLMKKTRIFDANQVDEVYAKDRLDQAFKEYKKAKKQAPLWRDDFIHNLASAIAKKKGTSKKSELKSLIHHKRQKKQAYGVKRVRGKLQDLSCFKIQVGEGQDLRTVDHKMQVEKAFLEANVRKFSQTEHTPPRTEQIINIIGEFGETEKAKEILEGRYVFEQSIDPLVKEFFEELEIPAKALNAMGKNQGVSTECHKDGWAKQKEQVSSEPTSLSFSHYKAALNDSQIAEMDSIFRSLPYQFGFVPMQWLTITDVQILKKVGVYHVDKMRTIMLMHPEFNMNNKLLGKEMMEFAERFHLLAEEQFGSRKHRHATAAALNKRLTFDILRQKRKSGAICSNDAKSCYDRIVHNIAALCMIRAGAPKEAVWSMFKTLRKSIHHIKTAFGVSNVCYKSDEHNLQGIGQGNGCGPAAWAAISSPLLNLMKKKGHGLKLTSALSNMITEFVAYAFVDDTDLVMSANNIMDDAINVLEQLQLFASDWDDALYLTGGAVVPTKSHWTLVNFTWTGNRWKYSNKEDTPGEIYLKHPDTRNPTVIKRIEPNEAEETLGVLLAGDGNNTKQIAKLRQKSHVFGQCIKSGLISRHDAHYALRSTVMKTLEYPLLVTNLNEQQWTHISSPAVRSTLPKMGFVRTFPKEIVHGPARYGGLEVQHLWHKQNIRQLKFVMEEMHRESIARNLLITSFEQLILEAGLGEFELTWPIAKVFQYVTNCWWKSLLHYCHSMNIKIGMKTPIDKYCSNDKLLMEEILKFNWKPMELRFINECRMKLRAYFLSEITTADGKCIEKWAWTGRGKSLWNQWEWPKEATLTGRHWRVWQKAISLAFLETNSQFRRLKEPLSAINTEVIRKQGGTFWTISKNQNRIFLCSSVGIQTYIPRNGRRNLRQAQFARAADDVSELPDDVVLASIEQLHNNSSMIALINCSLQHHGNLQDSYDDATFEQALHNVWTKDEWLWNEAVDTQHCMPLAQAILSGNLLAVSDGSYMEKFGTSASVLCDGTGNEMWLRSITPGDAQFQHSHRSELAGVAASVASIACLCDYFNINSGKATIGLDGLQAIDNILVDLPNAQKADYDLINFIRTILEKLPIETEFLWIKGHQDDLTPFHQLDFPAQMNVLADREAKSYLHRFFSSTVPDPCIQFSTEKWTTMVDGVKLCNIHPSAMYESLTGFQIQQYWCNCRKIPILHLPDIDWNSFGDAFDGCTFAQKRKLVKLLSGHAPVGKMMKLWRKQEHDRCPLCDEPGEDVHHMLTCCSCNACDSWDVSMVFLFQQLDDIETDPTITAAIIDGLKQWRKWPNRAPNLSRHSASWRLLSCTRHQNEIGWNNLLCGFISCHWVNCQHEYITRQHLQRTAEVWGKKAIKILWGIVSSLWDTRNHGKHELTPVVQQEKIDKLHNEIQEAYAQGTSDLQASDCSLLELPLEDLFESSWDYKLCWLRSVQEARARYQHHQQQTQQNLQRSRDCLQQWLRNG